MEANASSTTTRRGVLRTGAIGLGSVAGMVAASTGAEAAPALMTLSSSAQLSLFLKLGNILGDSVDQAHKDWIDLQSVQWGAAAASTTSSSTGTTSGKSSLSDIAVTMTAGKASPQVFLATMAGTRFANAVIEGVVATGDSSAKVLELAIVDAAVSSFSSSSGGSVPSESFSLSFPKVTYTIWEQRADGTIGGSSSATWDVRTSK
jgi:type VI secretion system secreted protein Hcp